jgi:hypothetical protein
MYRTAVETRKEVSVAVVETMMEYKPIRRCWRKKSKTIPERAKKNQIGTMKKKSIFCGDNCATRIHVVFRVLDLT